MNRKFFLEKLIYLTIFFLPTYLLRLRLFGIPTNFLEMLILTVIFFSFFEKDYRQRALTLLREHKEYFWGSALVMIGIMFSILANENYFSGLGIAKSWFVLPILFSFSSFLVLENKSHKNIFISYYFSAFATAVISLGYWSLDSLTYDGRLRGFFTSPNYLAMYLSPALIMALFQGRKLILNNWDKRQKNNFQSRIIPAFTFAVVLSALFLTFSYAAWFATGLALILGLALNGRINKKQIVLGLLIAIFIFFTQLNTDKLNNFIHSNGRSSFDSRIMIWKSAGKMLEENYLLGIGPGNFQEKYLDNQKHFSPYLEWAVPHPHNLFLAFWLYSGIFGLAGFLFLLMSFFRKFFREAKNNLVSQLPVVIMLYIFIHGLIDTTYFKNDLSVVFWLMMFFVNRKADDLKSLTEE